MIKKTCRAISNLLAQVPSLGWALCFLALIPVFAGIYTLHSDGFYHSTVRHEQSWHDLCRRIATGVHDATARVAGFTSEDKMARRGGKAVDPEGILVTSVEPADEGVSLRLLLPVVDELRNTAETRPVGVLLTDVYGLKKEVQGKTMHYYLAVPKGGDSWPVPPACIFPGDAAYPGREAAILPVPETLHRDIRTLLDSARGFPSDNEHVFWRMFYLSAVSITTLGYGDIVPINNTTRCLVSAEAILGLVLVGLFLNSLSHERDRRE
ncbi:MAG: potassium channel family protein [Desulfovibrio sp.]